MDSGIDNAPNSSPGFLGDEIQDGGHTNSAILVFWAWCGNKRTATTGMFLPCKIHLVRIARMRPCYLIINVEFLNNSEAPKDGCLPLCFKDELYAIWRAFKVLHMLYKRYCNIFICSAILGKL